MGSADGEFDLELWHGSRREALGRAAALLSLAGRPKPAGPPSKAKPGKQKPVPPQPCPGSNSIDPATPPPQAYAAADAASDAAADLDPASLPPLPFTVLLDDTFHYRSMRREARRVARRAQCGLVVVWVAAPLGTCQHRNAQRPAARQVPAASLARTHAALEPPLDAAGRVVDEGAQVVVLNSADHRPGGTSAETTAAALDAAGAAESKGGAAGSTPGPWVGAPCTDARGRATVWAAVRRAAALPLPASSADDDTQVEAARAAQAAAREATGANAVHGADLALRQLLGRALRAVAAAAAAEVERGGAGDVSATCADASGSLRPTVDPAALAGLLNEERRRVLEELRLGSLIPPATGCAAECALSAGGEIGPGGLEGRVGAAFLRRCVSELQRRAFRSAGSADRRGPFPAVASAVATLVALAAAL